MELSFLSDRALNSIKTAIACIIAFISIRLLHLEHGQWVLITIVVVMSGKPSYGGALQKSYYRVIGSMSGAFFAIMILAFFPNSILFIALSIFIFVVFFSFVASGNAKWSKAGILGGTTVVLILSASPVSIEKGFERTIEILAGVVLALLVNKFIFPVRARLRLKKNISKTLLNMKTLYYHTQALSESSIDDIKNLESNIDSLLDDQKALLQDAIFEGSKRGFPIDQFEKLILAQKKSFHTILLLLDTIYSSSDALQKKYLQVSEPASKNIQDCFEILSEAFEQKKSEHSKLVSVFKEKINILIQIQNVTDQSFDTIKIYTNTLIDQIILMKKNYK